MIKEINGITLKDADTNTERAILGLLADEAKKLVYGKMTVEVVVHKGKITHLDCYTTKKSFALNNIE